MWSNSFDHRLQQWTDLRIQCSSLDTESVLININNWWAKAPWCPYYLHWDDQEFWPDPWQLLDENIYCDLARGLGIMYTLMFIDRPEFCDARLQEYLNENLILVCADKYILNSSNTSVVNNNTKITKTKRHITVQKLKQKFL